MVVFVLNSSCIKFGLKKRTNKIIIRLKHSAHSHAPYLTNIEKKKSYSKNLLAYCVSTSILSNFALTSTFFYAYLFVGYSIYMRNKVSKHFFFSMISYIPNNILFYINASTKFSLISLNLSKTWIWKLHFCSLVHFHFLFFYQYM